MAIKIITQNKCWIFFYTDNEDPIILNMPANITQDTDGGSATAVVNWVEPHATDNSGSQSLTSSHSPGSSFSIGVTPVEYSALDPSGNLAVSTFVIDIKGTFTSVNVYLVHLAMFIHVLSVYNFS